MLKLPGSVAYAKFGSKISVKAGPLPIASCLLVHIHARIHAVWSPGTVVQPENLSPDERSCVMTIMKTGDVTFKRDREYNI